MSRCRPLGTLSLMLVTAPVLLGDPVGAREAQEAAQRWLARGVPRTFLPPGRQVLDVQTHHDERGQPLFHEVRLGEGGFLILAPDDAMEPVIAFSEAGVLDPSPDHPLQALLAQDLRARLQHAAMARRVFPAPSSTAEVNRSQWRSLLASQSDDLAFAPISAVGDVRVAPLLQSRWNQSKVAGSNVYNYFTPNNLVCGCVATAMAQLMRYHRWPTAGIGAKTFNIYVDGASQSGTTRGGDGKGGPYDWSLMPLVPSATTKDGERQMIGALCLDAGLSVNMSYAASGSGSNMNASGRALVQTFGYTNAIVGSVGGELVGRGLLEMVQPNLDAGFPVLFGIQGDGGHAIVCDGYGYQGTPATLYHHLNMGWGGSGDVWYNLPDIGTVYKFNTVNACVYNVFPSGKGEIVSGRITDAAGAPVPGVTVTNGSVTATTNASGIYALTHVTPGVQTLRASLAGASFPEAVRLITTASSDGAKVGNLPGVDLVKEGGETPLVSPVPLSQEVAPGGSVTFMAGATGRGPLHFQWLKNGQPVGTDAATYTLSNAAAADDQAAVQVRVSGSMGSALSPAATLSVVYLLNGGFESGAASWSAMGASAKYGTLYGKIAPRSGGGWARLGDHSTPATDTLTQKVSIPASATSARLAFWLGIVDDGAGLASVVNTLTLKILDANGSLLETLTSRDNTQAEVDGAGFAVWKPLGPFDLTRYKGQTIQVRFEAVQPGAAGTGTLFVVDDVVLPVSFGATPEAVATVTPSAWTLPTGGRMTFQAKVTGNQADNRVNWATRGAAATLSATQTPGDGLATTAFTAGSSEGITTVTATPVEAGGKAGTSTVTIVAASAVQVTLNASATRVKAGTTVTLSAQASPVSEGTVTWTCSGGSFQSRDGASASWSASAPGTYTLTATSVAAPSRSASVTVTVVTEEVQVTVSPRSWTMPVGGTLPLQAEVAQVSRDRQVAWAARGGSGTFSSGITMGDGMATTRFTAGMVPGRDVLVATSLESGTAMGTCDLWVVALDQISLSLQASAQKVDPGVPVRLQAKASPLSDGSLLWSCSGGRFLSQADGAASWVCDQPGVYTLTAACAAAPARQASVVVAVGSSQPLAIDPGISFLLPGQRAVLRATGEDGAGVEWSLPPGLAATTEGLTAQVTAPCVAPLQTLTFTFRATSRKDATRRASADVTFKGVDLDGSGALDLKDVLVLAGSWGKGPESPANLKGHGQVDESDLTALLNQMP